MHARSGRHSYIDGAPVGARMAYDKMKGAKEKKNENDIRRLWQMQKIHVEILPFDRAEHEQSSRTEPRMKMPRENNRRRS